jgi:hypothetical protein
MRSLVGHALDALSARGLRRSHQHSHDAAARLRKFFRRRCGRVVAGLTPASPLRGDVFRSGADAARRTPDPPCP